MSERVAADLPDYFPSDLELRLQDRKTFELLHQMGETNNYLFALGHKTLQLAAEPSIDNDYLTAALLAGVEAYEIVAATVTPDTYSDEAQRPVVVSSLYDFIGDIKKPEDFYAKAEYAKERLEADAPRLTEVIHEVTSPRVNRDKVAEQFALRGAATLRAMHIYVERRLAAA